jgi:DNA polymerase-3 subunit gamma/tau
VLALARRYRPKSFAEVAVQTHVSNTLRGAIARDRVAHGYLLCGPRGVGKTTLARVLAMALNCEDRRDTGEPCGECQSCTRIWSGSSNLDVVEIDAASNRGVDDARELRERAMYAPSGEHRWKVYIIDEAHMLTREAWNALLKILEEPPSRVVFVFATTEPQKIAQFAAPVLSRLQRFDLKRIGPADIRSRLQVVLQAEKIDAEPDALAMLARAADGSMRDALSLTDQVLALSDGQLTADRVREALGLVAEDEYIAVLDLIAGRRAAEVFGAVARLVNMGVDLGLFLTGFGDILRAQLAVTLGGDPGDLSERARSALEERKERLGAGDLLRMLSALAELEPRFRRSTQQQLLLETTLVRFALLDRTVAIEEVLRGLPSTGGVDSPDASQSSPASGARGAPGFGRPEGMRLMQRSDIPGQVPRLSDVPVTRREAGTGRTITGRGMAAAQSAVAGVADIQPDARTAPPASGVHVSHLNAIAGAWDDIVSLVRRDRPFIATLLEHALPVISNANGMLTLQADSLSVQEALVNRLSDTVAALKPRITGLQRLVVRAGEDMVAADAAERMTVATVRSETMSALRKRDVVLAAAIDTLDLELVD